MEEASVLSRESHDDQTKWAQLVVEYSVRFGKYSATIVMKLAGGFVNKKP